VYEIAGVALVDMEVWHWMYDHPTTTPAQLKTATLDMQRVFGTNTMLRYSGKKMFFSLPFIRI